MKETRIYTKKITCCSMCPNYRVKKYPMKFVVSGTQIDLKCSKTNLKIYNCGEINYKCPLPIEKAVK